MGNRQRIKRGSTATGQRCADTASAASPELPADQHGNADSPSAWCIEADPDQELDGGRSGDE